MRFLLIALLAATPYAYSDEIPVDEEATHLKNFSISLGYKSVFPALESVKRNASDYSEINRIDFLDLYPSGNFSANISGQQIRLDQFTVSTLGRISEKVSLGIQAGYESGLIGTLTETGFDPSSSGGRYNSRFEDRIEAYIFSLVSSFDLISKGIAALKLKAGVGWYQANLTESRYQRIYQTSPAASVTWEAESLFSGGSPLIELGLAGQFRFIEEAIPFASIDYRFSKITRLNSTKNNDFDKDGDFEIKTGDAYSDVNGQPLVFDLSGLSLSLGILFPW